ncbi:MAG: gamma-glutamylcyclotransferase [Rhizobiales bacterium]|nr:gamma-glutamylcyclotransferase [Hyphomicrobiales bacterium]
MKYFGYGTLLALENMQKVAPSASVDGYMRLDGYELGFGHCSHEGTFGCTLIEKAGAVTYGVQFDMSDDDMATLDKAAHVPEQQWVHKSITLIDEAGNEVVSSTYHIPGEYKHWQPTDAYVAPIYAGLEICPFPDDYKAFLKKLIVTAQNA